jgi:hypothetical protein
MKALREVSTQPPAAGGFMDVSNLDQALRVSDLIAKSQFCPKQFQNKPGDVIVAIQIGQELGIKPMQALQNISVINGRPSVWGDAVLGICRQAVDFEYIKESVDASRMIATCIVKRRNEPEITGTFSSEDAKKAGLWTKPGPWTQYPKRMLQMRARGFALRDAFADKLRGIQIREEVEDYIEIEEAKPSTINPGQVAELMELASQAEVSDDDLCRGAKVESIEELHGLEFSDYKNLCYRLIKKSRKIQGQMAIKELTNGNKEPEVKEIDVETGEVIE